MAMDQKDVSEFLKAITAELKKTQQRGAYDRPDRPERPQPSDKTSKTHVGDAKAMAQFAKIDWSKANKGLAAFSEMQKSMAEAMKPLGEASTVKGSESLAAISRGLHNLAGMDWAETKYGVDQLKELASPLSEMVNAVGKIDVKSVKTLNGIVAIVSDPVKGLVKTLEDFSKVVTKETIQSAIDMKSFFKEFALGVEEAATMPGGKEFKDNMDLFANSTKDMSLGLAAFAAVAFPAAIVNATMMGEFFRQFTFGVEEAATMPGGKEFKDNMDLFANSTKDMSLALVEFAKIDFDAAITRVSMMPFFFEKFSSGVSSIVGMDVKSFAEKVSLLSTPLSDLGEAIMEFSRIPIVLGMANALLMPAFFKMFKWSVDSVAKLNNTEAFADKASALAEPLADLSRAITDFSHIGFFRAMANALLMPEFFYLFKKSALSIPDDRTFGHKVKKLAKPLADLSKSILDFTRINFFKGIMNAGLMKIFVKAFQWGMRGIDKLANVIENSKPSIKGMGDVFELLGNVIGRGFGALGKQLKNIAMGSLAIGLIAGAMAVSALSFSLFAGIDWTGVTLGIVALGALSLGAIALGSTGPLIFIGAAAIAALGIALIPAAYAMKIAGEAMGLMVDSATKLIPNLLELAIAGPGLIATALALGVLSTSMLAFSAATTAGGWLSALGGNSIVSQVIELGKQADPLNAVADALDRIVASSAQLGSIAVPDQMGGVGRGQTMLTAQDQMSTAQTETTSQPIVVSAPGGNLSQKTSVVNNTTNVSNSIMPDRMAGMMPSMAYSF